MDAQRWTSALARVSAHDAADIDDIVLAFDAPRGAPGRDIFPEAVGARLPEAAMKRPGMVCVGVRVTTPLADAADRALRLIAFALEKDVELVVLSEVDLGASSASASASSASPATRPRRARPARRRSAASGTSTW